MTIRLIYGENERLLPWAAVRIGISAFHNDAQTIGLERDGEIVAAVVYDGFSAADCNMHIASDGTGRWLNKTLLLAAFGYPFTQLNLRRVTGLVPAKNKQAIAFDKHLGFRIEGYCHHALPDDDIVVMGMLRGDCKFIPKEQGA